MGGKDPSRQPPGGSLRREEPLTYLTRFGKVDGLGLFRRISGDLKPPTATMMVLRLYGQSP